MKVYENTMGINTTEFKFKICTYCPIGNDYDSGVMRVLIEMGDRYIDYETVQEFFDQELNGAEATSEDLVGMVFERMKSWYSPRAITVEFSFNNPTAKLTKTWKAGSGK